jgi:hypothetical protein
MLIEITRVEKGYSGRGVCSWDPLSRPHPAVLRSLFYLAFLSSLLVNRNYLSNPCVRKLLHRCTGATISVGRQSPTGNEELSCI